MLDLYDFEFDNYNNPSVIQELYVGETQFIKEFINTISKARAPYVGKPQRPINEYKEDFLLIGRMIADHFGFYDASFAVIFDRSKNAFTYPITRTYDLNVRAAKPTFVKDTGLKLDSHQNLCTMICVTSGIWFDKRFTDREIVAAILHEIGHSFTLQSNNITPMIQIYAIVLLVSTINNIILHIASGNMNAIPKDIFNIVFSSNKGKEITLYLEKQLAKSPIAPILGALNISASVIIGVYQQMIKELKYIIRPINNIANIPYAVFIAILKLITKPFTSFERSEEYLSDSFAVMYGLGPELSSFLSKLDLSSSPSGVYLEEIGSKIPVVSAMYQMTNIPILLIMNSVDTHPSTPARMNKIINELEKELKDSSLSPKTKDVIRRQIKDINKVKEEMITPSKKCNADAVKRLWFSYIQNDLSDNLEDYYTDIEARNKYLKEAADPLNRINII